MKSLELPARDLVDMAEEISPTRISQSDEVLSRSLHVGDKYRCQNRVGDHLVPRACEKLFDLANKRLDISQPHLLAEDFARVNRWQPSRLGHMSSYLMVIYNLDVVYFPITPHKADALLIVDGRKVTVKRVCVSASVPTGRKISQGARARCQ